MPEAEAEGEAIQVEEEEELQAWYEDPQGEVDERGQGDENSATERTETETTWSTWWNEEHGGSEPRRRSQKRRYEAVSDHEQPTKRRWPPAPQELARWGSNSSWRSAQSDGSRSEWSSWNNGGISQHDEDDIKQWLECSNVGDNVPETPIVPCKTPFEGWLADCAYQNGMLEDHQWFGKQELLQSCDEQGTPLGLVIDLVNTSKYYSGFQSCDGVEYHKVKIPGRCVPERDTLEEVFDIIDEFSERKPDLYVAIHCTHGLNRTGFLIAAYLMTRRSTPHWRDAVAVFEKARGGRIDKDYLLEALQQLEEGQY